jgi:hypothetical protein
METGNSKVSQKAIDLRYSKSVKNLSDIFEIIPHQLHPGAESFESAASLSQNLLIKIDPDQSADGRAFFQNLFRMTSLTYGAVNVNPCVSTRQIL